MPRSATAVSIRTGSTRFVLISSRCSISCMAAATAPTSPALGPNNRAARLQNFLGRPAILAAVAISGRGESQEQIADAPVVLSVKFIDDDVLAEIASRLQLRDLHKLDKPAAAGDYVLDLNDEQGNPLAQFAWTPKRPGAEIVNSVVPFLAIALAVSRCLPASCLRHMRRTAATIAAGENAAPASRPARSALRPAQPHLFQRAARGGNREGTPGRAGGGGLLHRSRSLQGRQRHARPPGRRRADPQRDAAAEQQPARRRYGGASRRRRIRGHHRRRLRPRRPAGDRQPHHRRAVRALRHRRADHRHRRLDRHCGRSTSSSAAPSDIMRHADMALYRAKNEGRNRACIYDAAMDADLVNRKLIENDLRDGDRARRARGRLPADRQRQRRDCGRRRGALPLAPC